MLIRSAPSYTVRNHNALQPLSFIFKQFSAVDTTAYLSSSHPLPQFILSSLLSSSDSINLIPPNQLQLPPLPLRPIHLHLHILKFLLPPLTRNLLILTRPFLAQ